MRNKNLINAVLYMILFIAIIVSIFIGAVKIEPHNLFSGVYNDVLKLRLARIWLGILAGSALSIAGLMFQGVLRNPLAEPYVLGISSGSALGAVLSMLIAKSGWLSIGLMPIISFVFGILTILLVLSIAKTKGKIPIQTLLLSGIIVGAVLSSILLFLISVSRSTVIHDAIWWLLGNLQIFNMRLLAIISFIVTIGIAGAYYFSKDLNAISLGEEEAVHLGVETEFVKKWVLAIGSLLTAAIVCTCGIIGFVGLIIPHLGRLLVGGDHRKLVPVIVALGGIFLITCDTISRTILLPAEIPIGAITALLGGPFFIYLLKTKGSVHFK